MSPRSLARPAPESGPGDDGRRLKVCLERTLELGTARLRLRDWPGFDGPLVHLPDPLAPSDRAVDDLATRLAPRYRVLSLQPRAGSAYQVDALDVLAMLDQFGFPTPILAGERLGCVPALLAAAWYPSRLAGLVLIEPAEALPPVTDPVDGAASVAALALRDCPPDWPALHARVRCPVLVLRSGQTVAHDIEAFLASTRGAC